MQIYGFSIRYPNFCSVYAKKAYPCPVMVQPLSIFDKDGIVPMGICGLLTNKVAIDT